MKVLRPSVDKPLEWEVLTEGAHNLIEVELADGQKFEISEERGEGLDYLCLRTRRGTLAIYPDVSNKIRFRMLRD